MSARPADPSPARGGPGALATVLAVLVVGSLLRFDGLSFGLVPGDPAHSVFDNNADERALVDALQDHLLQGDVHPGEALHGGSVACVLLGLVDAGVVGTRALLHGQGWSASLQALRDDPSPLFLAHRVASALAGLLTVLLLTLLARRELGPRAGLLAGLMLATGYLHVRQSHYGTVDTLFALLVLLVLVACLRLLRGPTLRRHLLAGLAAGACAAIRDVGAVTCVHVLAAHLLARRAARRAGASPPPGGRLLLAAVAALTAFVVLSPQVVFAPGDLIEPIVSGVDPFGSRPSPPDLAAVLGHRLRDSLGVGAGEPVLLLALAGLVLGLRRGGRLRALSLLVLLTLLVILPVPSASVRAGLPAAVALTLPAGLALDALLLRAPRWCGPLLVGLVLAPGLGRSAIFDDLIVRTDTRIAMLDTLRGTGLERTQVVAVGLRALPQPLHPEDTPYEDLVRIVHRDGPDAGAGLLDREPRALLVAPSFLDSPEAPLWIGEELVQRIRTLVAEEYERFVSIDGRSDRDLELPDPTAAGAPDHMVPYASPWRMTRPGPPLALYLRTTR